MSVQPAYQLNSAAEKVVGTWEEWATALKLLTRSATGQRISSYVSTVTGPRRPDDADGPDQFHLVIVDAGRNVIQRRDTVVALATRPILFTPDVMPVFMRAIGVPFATNLAVSARSCSC